MSRGRQVTLSGAWATLACAVAAALVVLTPTLLISSDPSRTLAVAVLAVALAAVATFGNLRFVLARGTASPVPTTGHLAPMARSGRMTDPAHHPLRPRAPGQA